MNISWKIYLLAVNIVIGFIVLVGGLLISQASANSNGTELSYVTQSTHSLTVIDRELQQVINNVDLDIMGCFEPWRARLTPSGSSLYVLCNGPSNLIVLSIPDLSLMYFLSYSGGAEDDIVFTPDERYAFISSINLTSIQVLDIASQSIISTIPLEGMGKIRNLDISPTGDTIYAAGHGSSTGRVYIIDAHTCQVVHMIDFGHEAWDVLAAPDNQTIYISDRWGGGIGVFDVKTYHMIDMIQNTSEANGLALSNDGAKIFAVEQDSESVDVYSLVSHKRLARISVEGMIHDLSLDCTGRKLYVASAASAVSVIDVHSYSVDTIQTPGFSYGIANCPQYQADFDSHKLVNHNVTYPGGLVKFSITMGSLITESIDNVVMTDTLPISLTYEEGSLSATSGMANYQNGVVSWSGSIPVDSPVTITFAETVPPTTSFGTSVTNEVFILANDKTYVRSANVEIDLYKSFIPCTSKACRPIFADNFSDPSSGWAIASGDGYAMGYDNGRYFIAVNKNWMAWSLLDFGLRDFRIEVDAWPAVSLDGTAAVMFSATSAGFYTFEINDGYYSVWRVNANNWSWTPLINWTHSPAIHPGYQVNRMKVIRNGNSILIHANDQLLGSFNDGTYRGTVSGMTSEAFTGYFDGRFDNFALYNDCLGTKAIGIPLNLTSSFGEFWTAPASGHTLP